MEEKNVPDWLIPNRVYDVLNGSASSRARARGFRAAVGPAWGFADTSAVVLTLNAFGALIGVLIGASALKGAAND